MKNRNRVASCKSEVWKDEQPPRSAARSLDHRSCGESSRRQPSTQGSHRQHYLIPREWLTSAVSPLHAKQIRSTKWLKSRSSMQESLKGKGTDTNCRERHSVVHSCISSIHAVTCRSDEHHSAVTVFLLPRKSAVCSCFRCVSSPSLLCAVIREDRVKEAHLSLERIGTHS